MERKQGQMIEEVAGRAADLPISEPRLERDTVVSQPGSRAPIPNLRHVRAIFLDLDDTLCGYWEASKYALRKAFETHGPEGHSAQDMIGHWGAAFRDFSPTIKQTGWYDGYLKSGEPTRTEQMRLSLLCAGIVDDERARKLSETYMTERDRALRLFEEALGVLEQLHAKFPLGLITNGPADVQRQEIETLDIGRFFDHILIEGEMGEGKPLERVFRRAEGLVGFDPQELLFVGNSYGHDIKPALDAGWHAIWMRRPSDSPPSAGTQSRYTEPAPDPADILPDAIIQDLRELIPMLG